MITKLLIFNNKWHLLAEFLYRKRLLHGADGLRESRRKWIRAWPAGLVLSMLLTQLGIYKALAQYPFAFPQL